MPEGTEALTPNVICEFFTMPTERVDLTLTVRVGNKSETKLLAENLRVIAVDRVVAFEGAKYWAIKKVTFAVTFQQAQELTFAEGVLCIIPRNENPEFENIFQKIKASPAQPGETPKD